jgi:hypothetical protein
MPYMGNTTRKASDIRRFDVTGSTSATHTLTWTAPNEQSLIVTINGVKQHEDAYSVSGTILTLTSALVSADKLEVIGINDVGTTITPAQNSVTADTIADGVITNAKIDASAAIALSKLATDPSDASNLASGTVPTARLGSGTASSSTILYGDSSWAAAPSSGFNSVQVFTSSGTWTKPGTGITKVIVEVQGAGGGGASDTTVNYAHTGAGGGYAKKFLDVSSISTSTITVGAGGAGIVNAGTPNDGGNSIWADGTNTITGNGGGGGSPNSSASSNKSEAGGTATGGDINLAGGPSSSNYTDVACFGMSQLGIPGIGYTGGLTPTLALKNATGYGAGGGGSGTSGVSSGSGSGGIVIVWEYK